MTQTLAPRLLAVMLIGFVLSPDESACEPSPRSTRTAEPEWVLLPLNIVRIPREYFAHGAEIMSELLAEDLRKRRVAFTQPRLIDEIRRWTRAVDEIGGLEFREKGFDPASVEKARQGFIAGLVEEYDARGVLWPDLLERKGRRKGGSLQWDGVKRVLSVGFGDAQYHAPSMGSSLRVRVYDAEGRELGTHLRGLEPVHEYYEVEKAFEGAYRYFSFAFRVRGDLFENRRLLRREIDNLMDEALP